MKSNKLGTLFLLLLLFFTLTIGLGCEKDLPEPDKKEPVVDNKPDEVAPEKEEKQPIKLLKRNGVEWKENTTINSEKGAEKYTVVWGDTLSLIARTWNVNCYKLAKHNGIKNIDLIEVDQVIYNYTYTAK